MKGNPYKAFTLVELMMSVAIMGFMSAILLWNYPDSNVKIKMVNFTQTTALLVREAQIRGSSITSQGGDYAGFGVYFSLATSSEITLFADEIIPGNYKNGILVGDGLKSTTTITEVKSLTTLPTGYVISNICVYSGSRYYCKSDTNPAIDSISISFIRPNPQPAIYVNDNALGSLTSIASGLIISEPFTGACIELSSPKAPNEGHVRSIYIEGVGSISTKIKGCN
jgi:prepilin-type N-terminal cleavage/methylation domain-containing protein